MGRGGSYGFLGGVHVLFVPPPRPPQCTALDLLERGLDVHVVVDGCSSRRWGAKGGTKGGGGSNRVGVGV